MLSIWFLVFPCSGVHHVMTSSCHDVMIVMISLEHIDGTFMLKEITIDCVHGVHLCMSCFLRAPQLGPHILTQAVILSLLM